MNGATPVVRVALVGYGLGGANFHAPFIARTPGLELTAVLTGNAARRAAVQAQYPEARVYSEWDAMIGERPDLVVISSPNSTHFPLAAAALEAGAHVVVDKPFARTAAEARRLGVIAAEAGRLAIPFQNRRWDGDFLTLRALVEGGSLGEIVRVESRFDRWRPEPKAGWCRPDARERAENIVHDLGTHLVDQVIKLFGPVAWVHAEIRRVNPQVTSWDDMFISLTHANGVQSHLSSMMRAGIAGPRYHAFGTEGAYVKHGVDPQEAALRAGVAPDAVGFGEEAETDWGRVGNGTADRMVPTLRGDYSAFYTGVHDAIVRGAAPPVTVDEAVAVLEVIESVLEFAR